EAQNIALEPKDQVRIYSMLKPVEKVSLSGEVMRPGDYEITEGDRLSDLVRRIGGFTKEAYAYGVVFKRVDVKNRQDQNLQSDLVRMQSQVLQIAAAGSVSAMSPEDAAASKSELALNQSLLENLKSMKQQNEGRVA
ncbi:SLBB domain-containing protein, partial [Staphylococcus equorum]|uniref:SLBB domain-containing protein n=1 Tax=Staphylococcus equorum TaxID=246432 RepID=UPI0018E56B8C